MFLNRAFALFRRAPRGLTVSARAISDVRLVLVPLQTGYAGSADGSPLAWAKVSTPASMSEDCVTSEKRGCWTCHPERRPCEPQMHHLWVPLFGVPACLWFVLTQHRLNLCGVTVSKLVGQKVSVSSFMKHQQKTSPSGHSWVSKKTL